MRVLMDSAIDIRIQRARPEDAPVVALLAQVTFRQAFGTVWKDPVVLKNYLRETFAVEKVRNSIGKPLPPLSQRASRKDAHENEGFISDYSFDGSAGRIHGLRRLP